MLRGRVLVYRYQFWDEETQWRRISSLYATADMIHNGLGIVLHDTALEVDVEALHGTGIYDPLEDHRATEH